ncbi:hypothetical protein KP509_08G028700 [Ceratopteris richardii]|uniref:Uncharacterized protein n=1 Tax=Ceratopteris richardii TaxID=49495 RepID=A0A8T2UB96_CERRI|nr:hypothetical protein KP509_08G028700 [Ceratopteris richardii]
MNSTLQPILRPAQKGDLVLRPQPVGHGIANSERLLRYLLQRRGDHVRGGSPVMPPCIFRTHFCCFDPLKFFFYQLSFTKIRRSLMFLINRRQALSYLIIDSLILTLILTYAIYTLLKAWMYYSII